MEGPDKNYTFDGYLEFAISSGPIKATVTSKGFKRVRFKDGQTIMQSHNDDSIWGVLMGGLGHQQIG
jgi:hypothetical protein